MSIVRITTRPPGQNADGPQLDADLDNIITPLNVAIDTTIPALTTLLNGKRLAWIYAWFNSGAAASQKPRFICPAGTAVLVTMLKAVFTSGSAAGTSTFSVNKISGGVTTVIGTMTFSGSADAIGIVKTNDVVDVSLSENDQVSLTSSASGSQQDLTIQLCGSEGLA